MKTFKVRMGWEDGRWTLEEAPEENMITEWEKPRLLWNWRSWLVGVCWFSGTLNVTAFHLGPISLHLVRYRWTAKEWASFEEQPMEEGHEDR